MVVEQSTIIIEPAAPQTIYVPVYTPTVIYGAWPYPAYPPVYFLPPAGCVIGTAFLSGLAFATGVAVVGSLSGWARPTWGGVRARGLRQRQCESLQHHQREPYADKFIGVAAARAGLRGGPVGVPGRPVPLPRTRSAGRTCKSPAALLFPYPEGAGRQRAGRRKELLPPVIDSAVDFRIDGSAMTEMHRDRETDCREEVCGDAQR